MYKSGFQFRIVKNGYIGCIDGVSTNGIYSVCFYDTEGSMYLRADVYEDTITNNLESGIYEAI